MEKLYITSNIVSFETIEISADKKNLKIELNDTESITLKLRDVEEINHFLNDFIKGSIK